MRSKFNIVERADSCNYANKGDTPVQEHYQISLVAVASSGNKKPQHDQTLKEFFRV